MQDCDLSSTCNVGLPGSVASSRTPVVFSSVPYTHPGHSTRDFFLCVSNKFLDNTVLSLGGSSTHGSVRYRRLPEVMREKWQGVMQQLAAGPYLIDGFVAALPSRAGVEDLEGLCDHVKEVEVRKAIRKCHQGKACGPDELGNDWYLDHIDGLASLCTKLCKICKIWLEGGVVPVTFGDSNVSCIKKTSSAAVPLDYRDIALLDLDYKIYTRVLATLLRQHLPKLVYPLQAGLSRAGI